MLLYAEGDFFQVIEGHPDTVEELFKKISADERHGKVTVIIREPIAQRSFADWTMGYADLSAEEAESAIGVNDFFSKGNSLGDLTEGRAKKLLSAFKQGRWRSQIHGKKSPSATPARRESTSKPDAPAFSYAFQPIVNASTGNIFSYEALVRGPNNEPAGEVLGKLTGSDQYKFDEHSRTLAIEMAAKLGIDTRLNLNMMPRSIEFSSTALTSVVETAKEVGIEPNRIVLEILENEIINNVDRFREEVESYRIHGINFAIDDFGAGYAGLNLLADFQPDIIKLDMALVRGIESNGPRQAIVRGLTRTCMDLGIDIIAEGIETQDEFLWLRNEGVELFQGLLLAGPAFEQLAVSFSLPEQ
ncbi:diguanylate phosphodiesterase [Halioglobus maricola]|uniref:Diguanylate phosphodiesterase n=2 Tax=Halioglobus maricola TaxID=2601894 RepID=A0A5P9NKC6_9GAMM|nr:diguanylate phosphodiesterase [Halioglobus maricola]